MSATTAAAADQQRAATTGGSEIEREPERSGVTFGLAAHAMIVRDGLALTSLVPRLGYAVAQEAVVTLSLDSDYESRHSGRVNGLLFATPQWWPTDKGAILFWLRVGPGLLFRAEDTRFAGTLGFGCDICATHSCLTIGNSYYLKQRDGFAHSFQFELGYNYY